jgi:hypothetical protein
MLHLCITKNKLMLNKKREIYQYSEQFTDSIGIEHGIIAMLTIDFEHRQYKIDGLSNYDVMMGLADDELHNRKLQIHLSLCQFAFKVLQDLKK